MASRRVQYLPQLNGWVATCPDCNWARFGFLTEVHDLATDHNHDKVWIGPKPYASHVEISAAVGTSMNTTDPRPASAYRYGFNRRPNVW